MLAHLPEVLGAVRIALERDDARSSIPRTSICKAGAFASALRGPAQGRGPIYSTSQLYTHVAMRVTNTDGRSRPAKILELQPCCVGTLQAGAWVPVLAQARLPALARLCREVRVYTLSTPLY